MAIFRPARPNDPLDHVETPALLLDLDALEANLAQMALSVEGTGIALRPHAKTHKCAAIGRRQIAAGAVGLCVQKVGEAEALMHAGITDIRVTNQVVDPRKIARLCALAELGRISVCADSLEQLPLLDAAARDARIRLPVLVEIDVGSGRCGTRPGVPAAELATAIAGSRHLAKPITAGRSIFVMPRNDRRPSMEPSRPAAGLSTPWLFGASIAPSSPAPAPAPIRSKRLRAFTPRSSRAATV
jgi:hypothetical protein